MPGRSRSAPVVVVAVVVVVWRVIRQRIAAATYSSGRGASVTARRSSVTASTPARDRSASCSSRAGQCGSVPGRSPMAAAVAVQVSR